LGALLGRGGLVALLAALLYGALSFCASAVHAQSALSTQESTSPFVALILPVKSKQLRTAAETVRAGVLAQEQAAGAGWPRVRVFETGDGEAEASEQFVKAWESGAVAVIGPLTRSALSDMANNVSHFPIPVVALNHFDETTPRRSNLFSLSLSLEQDAQQVAALMREEGVRNPVLILSEARAVAGLSKRMAQGFRAGWGEDLPAFEWRDVKQDGGSLKHHLAGYDAIFLAVDARTASQIRPYLGTGRPIYATSQIDPGRHGGMLLIDLAGIRYLEAPWLAEPDLPGYEVYARTRSPANDIERLFALGADAWIVAQKLARGETLRDEPGLSGMLTLDEDQIVRRQLVARALVVNVAPTPLPAPTDESVPIETLPFPFSQP